MHVLAHLSKQAKPDEFLLQDHYNYLIVPRRFEQCCLNLIFVYSVRSKRKKKKRWGGDPTNRDSSESPSLPVNFPITEVVSLLSSLPFSLSLAGPKRKLFHTTTRTTSSNTENINIQRQRRRSAYLYFTD